MEIKSFEELKNEVGKDGLADMISRFFLFDEDSIKGYIDDLFPIKADNEDNYQSYLGINNLVADDIRQLYTDNLDAYIDDIINLFEEHDIYFDARLDDDDIANICDEFLLEADDNEQINSLIEDIKEEYDIKYGSYPYFNEYGNYYNNPDDIEPGAEVEEIAEDANITAMPEEIPDLDDNIGDVIEVDGIIDIGTRDETFVYADGQVFIGDGASSHSQIIMQHLQEENENVTVPNPGEENFFRMNKNRARSLLDATDIAFGHILGDCCFIETIDGVDVNTVAKAVKEDVEYGIDKVYQYNRDEYLARRVASKVSRLMKLV